MRQGIKINNHQSIKEGKMEILIAKNDKQVRLEQTSKTLIVICEPVNYQGVNNYEFVDVIVADDNLHLGSVLVIALDYAEIDSNDRDYLKVAVQDERAIRVFDTQFPLEVV